MADIVVTLTKKGREFEAQQLLYGYGFKISFFAVGSGGHDPGNPTLALPLDPDVTELPGQFFGPEPIDKSVLFTSTCPKWTCILQPGEAVGGMSDFGLIAAVVFVPSASFFVVPSEITVGTSNVNFAPASTNTSTGTLTLGLGHGFVDGVGVVFNSSVGLPAGINNTTQYFVVNSTATSIQVELSPGGGTIVPTNQGTGTHTVRLASDDTITHLAHGLTDGNIVNFITTGTVPGGLIAAQSYYVVNSTSNTFKVSPILNGPSVDLTTAGVGVHTVTNLSSLPTGAPLVGSTFLYAQANFPLRTKLSASRETMNVTLQT